MRRRPGRHSKRPLQLDPGNKEALGDLFDFYMEAPGLIGGGMDKAAGLLPQFARYDPVELISHRRASMKRRSSSPSAEANLRQAIEAAPRKVGLVVSIWRSFWRGAAATTRVKHVFRQAAERGAGFAPHPVSRAPMRISRRDAISDEARDLLKKYLASNNLTPDDPPRWEAQRIF